MFELIWCLLSFPWTLPCLCNGVASQKVGTRDLSVDLSCGGGALFIRLQSLPQALPNQSIFLLLSTTNTNPNTTSTFLLRWTWTTRKTPQNLHLSDPLSCSSPCCFLCCLLSCHLHQVFLKEEEGIIKAASNTGNPWWFSWWRTWPCRGPPHLVYPHPWSPWVHYQCHHSL